MAIDNRKVRFGLWYDFRNPQQWRQPSDRLYGEIIDQIAWGEGELGLYRGNFRGDNNAKTPPEAIQRPHPPFWIGGFTPPALRRAARYGDGFTAPGANRDVYDRYVAELQKQGKPTSNIRFAGGFNWLIVSDDPEKTWNEAADHIIYQADNYLAWSEKAGQQPNPVYLRDREGLRKSGHFKVVDPETAIKTIREYLSAVPVTHYYSWTLPPGLPPRWAQRHLSLFASEVIPAINSNGSPGYRHC